MLFGDKAEFAIEYGHLSEVEPEIYNFGTVEDYKFHHWVQFWVKGKNLFLLECEGEQSDYSYDINLLIEFFCEGLLYQLQKDPLPVTGIKTKNHYDARKLAYILSFVHDDDLDTTGEDSDLIDITEYYFIDKIDVDFKNSQYFGVDKEIAWEDHHCLNAVRQTSFLPSLCIARHYTQEDKIEICNVSDGLVFTNHEDMEFRVVNNLGVHLIDIKLYKQVIIDFCLDFINTHKAKHPKWMQRYLDALSPAMTIEV